MIGKHYKKLIVLLVIVGGTGAYLLTRNGPALPPNFDMSALQHPTFVAISSGIVDVEGGLSTVSANSDGVIKQVMVKEGDNVEKGQVLAIQEDEAERISLEIAKIRLESQKAQNERLAIKIKTDKRELERITPLFELGAVTRREFDTANDAILQNKVDSKINSATSFSAKVEVKKAQFNLAQKTIRAPLSGRVVSVAARPGIGASTVNVSTLFTIIPDAQRIVRATVDEVSLSDVYVGQKVHVLSNIDRVTTYDATVSVVSQFFPEALQAGSSVSAMMGGGQSIDVILTLADGTPFLIGQKVQVHFLRDNKGEGS